MLGHQLAIREESCLVTYLLLRHSPAPSSDASVRCGAFYCIRLPSLPLPPCVYGYCRIFYWYVQQYREILLAFEPLHGSHEGADLSDVLLDLLKKHQIEDRVLTMTTDNASNNTTLLNSIKGTLDSLMLPDGNPIVRIPCMAHVIQHILNELLGRMEAVPKNDREEKNEQRLNPGVKLR